MATIRAPWGPTRGTIGNLVFRERDNVNTISSVPSSFNTPTDPASVSRRTKFSFVVKLSSTIIKLFSLKLLWQRTAPVGNYTLNKVFKKTYKAVKDTLDLADVRLSSAESIMVPNPEINILATGVQVNVVALGQADTIDLAKEKTIHAEGVIHLSSPNIDDTSAPQFSFIPLTSPDIALVLNDPLSFALPISGANRLLADRYQVKKAAIVLVTRDEDGNPVQCSETITS